MKYSCISKIVLRWKWIRKVSNRIMLTKQKAILNTTLEYTNYGKNINYS